MRIQRWGDEVERPVAEIGRNTTLEVVVYIGLILAFAWIMTRPVTAVQHVDHWPAPVPAEVDR